MEPECLGLNPASLPSGHATLGHLSKSSLLQLSHIRIGAMIIIESTWVVGGTKGADIFKRVVDTM